LEDRLKTAQEIADYLQIPLSAVYDLTHRKAIPFLKIGSRLRFRKSEIEAWLDQQSEHPSGQCEGVGFDALK
jgi:excisionase family DNA binding protein